MIVTKAATVSAIAALAGGLAAGTSVMAQQAFTPEASAAAQLSAYGQTPQKTIDLSAGVQYDSNVARSDSELAAERGLTLSDEIFTPAATVVYVRPLGPGQVFLNANASYNFYVNNRQLNREHIDVLGGIAAHILYCRDTLTGSFDRFQSDLSDIDLIATENVVSQESIRFNASCGRTIGLSPGFSVGETWKTNSNPILADTDTRTFSSSASLAYQRPTLGALGLFGEFERVDYTQGIDFFGFLLPDTLDIYSAGVRYDRHLGTRIEGAASIAYTELTSTFPGARGFKGLTYNVDFSYKAGSRLGAHVLFTRATLPSTEPDAQFTLNTTYQADLTYMLSSRLSAKLTGSIQDHSFQGVNVFDGFDLTDRTLYDVLAEADVKMSRRISFAFTVGEEVGDANLPEFRYLSTRLGLVAKATF